MTQTPLILSLPLAPVLWWIAWSDLARMTIPNRAVLAMLVIFLVPGLPVLGLAEWATRLGIGGLVLIVVFLLSGAGVMGAGDAKAIAALAPFVAPPDLAGVLVMLAAALVLGLLLHRAVRRLPVLRALAPRWASWSDAKMPAGLSIAATMGVYIS